MGEAVPQTPSMTKLVFLTNAEIDVLVMAMQVAEAAVEEGPATEWSRMRRKLIQRLDEIKESAPVERD